MKEKKLNEKKLTDEEIVKALDFCSSSPCCGSDCPYFNKHGRNFCVEDNAFYKDMKRIVLEHAEQKAEIERLTEENGYIKAHADQFLADYQKAQKQVDELTEERENMQAVIFGLEAEKRQAVKDTAKEICLKIIKGQPQPIQKKWIEWFKKEYGVEVE